MPGVHIGLYAELGGRSQPLMIQTDDGGRFRFGTVNTGRYRLTVQSGRSLREFIDNVQVDWNKRINLEIVQNGANKPRLLLWVPASTGTHLGGSWVVINGDAVHQEQRVDEMTGEQLRRLQDRTQNYTP